MTTPMCEDSGPLKEWAPLTLLLQQIPAKVQNGIFTHDISFTCIDVVPEFIAIGTNYGLVYWYDREHHDLQRLRCENTNSKITCIRVISTVEYMVAVGNEHGAITIFQIPKEPPDSLPESLKPKQKKQVERYSISGLHKTPVTTIEWSKNGMKLFSGDQNGLVVLTEIDFYMHLSKSSELLNEKYSVVQLSYHKGLLLVSTTLRTILVNRNENDKVIQVGQKERKILGKLGAVFGSRQSHVQDLTIYASRPGLRLWQADKTGTVSKTLIFKEAMNHSQMEVELLNPAPKSGKKNRCEVTFGPVLPFCEDLLVTYSDDVIYVVNPNTIAITSVISNLRHITDVACTKDEILILEGERNILRIAYYPESNNFISDTCNNLDPIASIASISKSVTTSILELTTKLKDTSIVPAIPFYNANSIQSIGASVVIGTDTTSVINAEEAEEMPPIVPINLNTPLKILETDRREIFEKIGQQEFEDVVFAPGKKDKSSHDGATCSIDLNEHLTTTRSSLMTFSMDDRNLDSIQQDVEMKEKLLADVLDFDLSKYMSHSKMNYPNREIDSIDIDEYINDYSCDRVEEINNLSGNNSVEVDEEEEDDSVSYTMEIKKLEELEECRKQLLQSTLSFEDHLVDRERTQSEIRRASSLEEEDWVIVNEEVDRIDSWDETPYCSVPLRCLNN